MRAVVVAILCVVAGILCWVPGPCHAMNVSPIQLEMMSAGTSSRGAIRVTNESPTPLPVEVSVRRLTQDENGNRTYSPGGEEEFLLLPPQALIPPGASQVFRVQWVGEPMLAESQSFMLFVSQVPVKPRPGSTLAVQVVMSIGCMVNVAPPRGAPSLRITGTGVSAGESGRRHPTLTVFNPTSTHAFLPHATIRLSAAGWSKELASAELGSKLGIGLVQPGKQRRFVLPVALPDTVRTFTATIDFRPVRP
jgi:fimbrial chaperone protein